MEYEALLSNNMWDFKHKFKADVVTDKWIFKHKFKEDDSLDRYKARWVLRGSPSALGCSTTRPSTSS
jgi:hypothetical protein